MMQVWAGSSGRVTGVQQRHSEAGRFAPCPAAVGLQNRTLAGRRGVRASQSLTGRHVDGARSNGTRWWASQWLENNAEQEVAAPVEECWVMWEDRERIPSWMPWIKSVKVLPEDDRMSRWTLSTNQFNQEWSFTWLAQNLTPVKYQKLHWRSVQGSTGGSFGGALDIANRGQIRFYKKSPSSCAVKLTISYEVPDILAPFANAVTPIVENILRTDLKRFAELAEAQKRQAVSS